MQTITIFNGCNISYQIIDFYVIGLNDLWSGRVNELRWGLRLKKTCGLILSNHTKKATCNKKFLQNPQKVKYSLYFKLHNQINHESNQSYPIDQNNEIKQCGNLYMRSRNKWYASTFPSSHIRAHISCHFC